jgi:ubiquinone/menaquinone biosynthesis C-methylase UbiE
MYEGLNPQQIREEMNKRYETKTAYELMLLWDQARMQDLNEKTMAYLGSAGKKKILEVCCGQGGTAAYLPKTANFTGVDLSDTAIALAKETFKDRPNYRFQQMDACKLDFEDSIFDVVIAKEAIEHLPDVGACLREAYRVLKPTGKLIVTSPNRDSLHLRMNRLMGNADFKCSYDHLNELTFAEFCELATAAGFQLDKSCGSFLMPYWGIPGVDNYVRHLTDKDPAVIALFQELGDLVGAEHAFCYIALLSKIPPSPECKLSFAEVKAEPSSPLELAFV